MLQEVVLEELRNAIRSGNLVKVEQLITCNKLYNTRSWGRSGGHFLLLNALWESTLEVILLLLKSGCSVVNLKRKNRLNKPYELAESPLNLVINNTNISDIDKKSVINLLLKRGATVDDIGEFGKGPLHLAASNGDLFICDYLLQQGARIDSLSSPTNKTGSTALHFAARRGLLDVVKLLVGHGASINIPGGISGFSPLHITAKMGNMKITEFLLDEGASVDSVATALNGESHTAFSLAARNEHFHVMQLLVERKANVNYQGGNLGFTPLHRAAQKGNVKTADFLLHLGALVDSVTASEAAETPLCLAIHNNHLDLAKLLINHKANIHYQPFNDGLGPLHIAASIGYAKIMEYLLQCGAMVDSVAFSERDGSRTALMIAVQNELFYAVKLLVEYKANIHYEGGLDFDQTALLIAVEKKNMLITEYLLKRGAFINTTNREGKTPLFVAITNCNNQMVRLLLNYGALVDAKDKEGKTALCFAVQSQQEAIVQDVIDRGPDKTDTSNQSAFCKAILASNSNIVNIMLRYGFMVRPEDRNSNELLSSSIEKGYFEIAKTLLLYGADIHSKPDCEFTHLHMATQGKHWDILELLIDFGATWDFNNKEGKAALAAAVWNKDAKSIKLLTNAISCPTGIMHIWKFVVDELDFNSTSNSVCDKFLADVANNALEKGASVNTLSMVTVTVPHTNSMEEPVPNHSILHLASLQGYEHLIKVFIHYGADMTLVDSKMNTPLLCSIEGNYYNIVEILLTGIVNINAKNVLGRTALHQLSQNCNDLVYVKLLLAKGARINSTDCTGRTPLHMAVIVKNITFVRHLLFVASASEVNSAIDAKDDCGKTALNFAVDSFSVKLARFLLHYGANVNQKFSDFSSPLEVACRNNKKKLLQIILKYGADINSINIIDYNDAPDIQRLRHLQEVLERVNFEWNGPNLDDYFDWDDSDSDPDEISMDDWHNNTDIMDEKEPCESGDLIDESDELKSQDQDDMFYCGIAKDKFYAWGRNSLFEMLALHVIKLITAEFHVSDSNLNALESFHQWNYYKMKTAERACMKEIELLKSDMIGNSSYSFFSWLHKSPHQAARILASNNALQTLRWGDIYKKYPIYYDIVRLKLKSSMLRLEFLDILNDDLHKLFNPLPHDCIQLILKDLSDEDLKMLVGFFERLTLSQLASPNLSSILAGLPQKCINKVLHFLGNEDMKALSSAVFLVGKR